MKRSLYYLFTILFVLVTTFNTGFAVDVYAAAAGDAGSAFSDMPKDWSQSSLENAVQNGLLSGYDGKIMPKENITRAQLAAVVNRAFGSVKEASLEGFSDVPANKWYYGEMAKAVQMQTFLGGSGGKLNPNNSITREEAFTVLARAFKLSGADKNLLGGFKDSNSVSKWAEDSVASLVKAGYVNGSNGMLEPKKYITRAEFAQLMDNLLKHYIVKAGSYTENMTGNLMIKVADVTLKDMTISGDLIIGDGVGDGNVTLDNVNITGRTVIRGGGPNSIRIIGNSNVGTVIVSRIDGVVRVKVEGDAQVNVINVADGSDDVVLAGEFGDIELDADDVIVTALSARINDVKISGDDSEVIVGTGSNVANIGISGQNAKVTGTGTAPKIEVLPGGDNASITTPNSKISVAGGVTGVKGGGGEALNPGTSGTNNTQGSALEKTPSGHSSGGSGGNNPPVFNISASVGGDSYVNSSEATATAAISVVPTNGTIQSVTVSGINIDDESELSVPAVLNETTGKYEFDATSFKDGTLTVTACNANAVEKETTLTLDTRADKLITGGKLVELTGTDNPLSDVNVIGWAFPASGDLNGDGRLDVIVGDMAGHVYTYYQKSNGTYRIADPDPLNDISTGMYTFPGLGDLDGDGDLDLILGLGLDDYDSPEAGYVQYYENTGTADNPAFTLKEGADNPFAAVYQPLYAFNAVGDVDDDGDADVLFGYGNKDELGQALELWTNDGDGHFTTGSAIFPFSDYNTTNGALFVVPYLGDFNGDGKLDAGIFSREDNHSIGIKFYEGDGSGTYNLNEERNPFNGISVQVPFASAGDLDGDGDADFLIGDGLDEDAEDGGTIRSFQNNVGEAVALSDSQIRSGNGSDHVTTDATESLLLSGKGAESRAQISIYVDGNLLAEVQANADGEWTYTWLGTEPGCPIAAGHDYAVTVEQTDLAGNVSDMSDSYTIRTHMDD